MIADGDADGNAGHRANPPRTQALRPSNAAYLSYACSTSFLMATINLILLGVCFSICGSGFATFQQAALPRELAGRVQNLLTSSQQALNVGLTLAAGFAVHAVGVRLVMQVVSMIGLITGLALAVIALQPRHQSALAAGDNITPSA
ncbi:hypothetical protein [Alicyclobacillus herbarius]|uniref:hypothetical protein n=1 Tax=Alicyclobacillus herbarius TaxID=122960 RepID=UPI00047D9BEA|nr:hypothetical protein [Alicyclobacillus herbarius]